MNNVNTSFTSINNSLLFVKISLNKLELIIQLSKCFLEWLQLLWVLGGSNSSSYFETTMLEEI
jgi:hypothetical protein